MTDKEIIKALKECEECHYYNECEKSTRLALALINRQQAEIKGLRDEIEYLIKKNEDLWETIEGWDI